MPSSQSKIKKKILSSLTNQHSVILPSMLLMSKIRNLNSFTRVFKFLYVILGIDGFHSRDKTSMLEHKTIEIMANALHNNRVKLKKILFSFVLYTNIAAMTYPNRSSGRE